MAWKRVVATFEGVDEQIEQSHGQVLSPRLKDEAANLEQFVDANPVAVEGLQPEFFDTVEVLFVECVLEGWADGGSVGHVVSPGSTAGARRTEIVARTRLFCGVR